MAGEGGEAVGAKAAGSMEAAGEWNSRLGGAGK